MKINNMRFLFLYRSFLFRYIVFETDNKKYKDIVRALNIKNRRDRITFIYDSAIRYINKYYSSDLCKFEDDRCIVQRNNNSNDKYGCCKFCPLVTDDGCPSSNVSCKLIYCKTALGNLKLLKLRDIDILKCLSMGQRFILKSDFFLIREDVINDLYYGFIYTSFKSCYKEVIKIFKEGM